MRCSKCGAEYSDNFCPHCGAPIDTNAPTKRTHNLFGFRSNKWWKKVLSAFYLSFCAIMLIGALLSDKTGKITTYDYIIDKIHSLILLSILFSPYIFLSNTKFRSKLPLLKKHTFISSSISMMIIVILLFTIFGFVNTLHSAEYLEDMENHAYVQTAETAATCETDGQIERLCEYCGRKKTEIIPATGHKMNETARESATETNDGKIIETCELCGKQEITIINRIPTEDDNNNKESVNPGNDVPVSTSALQETTSELSKEEKELKRKKDYIATCETVKYKDLARQPEKYRGKQLCFKGKVFQVSEPIFGNRTTYLIYVTSSEHGLWDDSIYVTYTVPDSAPKILEDDIIIFYGKCKGDYTYISVLGTRITIPRIDAKYIDIIEQEYYSP